MKKILGIVAVILVLSLALTGCNTNTDDKKEDKSLSYTVEEFLDLVINKAVEEDPDTEYGMKRLIGQKNVVNSENLEDILGITEDEFNKSIDGAMESKPDDTWSPHSVIFVKVKDGVDVKEMAEKITMHTRPDRFGCLRPEAVTGTYYDKYIMIVVSDKETSNVVLKSFDEIVECESPRIERENDWQISFFEE